MTSRVDIRVLCEGRVDAIFLTTLLVGLRYNPRKIRVEVVARAAGGDPRPMIREQYPHALAALRAHRKKPDVHGLVVMIDGDGHTVEARRRWVEDFAGTKRAPAEHVAILVPRRSIEAWILALDGAPIDEEGALKRTPAARNAEARARPTASRVVEVMKASGTAATWPPSLVDAIAELKSRLPKPSARP